MKKILVTTVLTLMFGQAYADLDSHESRKHGMAKSRPCNAKDLNGDYVMFQAAVNKPELNHTGRCEININDGTVSGRCAFGRNVSGNPNFNGPVYGSATINTNCSADVTISFDPVPDVVHIDSYFDLQFAPDKLTFVGSFSNSFGVEGISNGTRYSVDLPATPAD